MPGRVNLCLVAWMLSCAAWSDSVFVSLPDSEVVRDGGLSRGVAWGDYDNDGDPDLIVANTINYPEFLYRNNDDGSFTQVFEIAPTLAGGFTEGVNWIDFDNDGDLDLFTVRTRSSDALYRNTNGSFERIDAVALTTDITASYVACWGDYDNDGWLDVFIVNSRGESDRLYRNEQGEKFERVRHGRIVNNGGDGRACGWGDADNDGDLDLYVGNNADYLMEEPTKQRNYFYSNDGDGTFTEITTGMFVTEPAQSYGVSWVDFDDDDDLDLFVTNIGRTDRNWLLINDGSGSFELSDSVVVTDSTGPSKGHTWGDFDLDGDVDLYVVNGTENWPDVRNFLYRNDGNGNFVRLLEGAPVEDRHISAGTAWADADRDGDLDLYVANWGGSDEDNDFYRNDTSGKHWISLSLVGTASNRSAVGTKVTVTAVIHGTRRTQTRWLLSSTGFASQNEPIVHFGLGDATEITELAIVWPSGRSDRHRRVGVDRLYTAPEGSALQGE